MPAVLEKPAPAERFASEVDEQLAQATSRIRFHDVAFGGILLAAMVLIYATAMIVVDKFAVLPEWARQLGLFSFVAALGAVAYLAIIRPLRRRVNPLYAAVQVEKTIEDAKNSVVGYVEAQENGNVHPAVKTAMGARAARSVGEADVNRAVDHRSLVWAGGVAVVFLLTLIVLFFVFRPAQFRSLAARTFVPFSSDPIASRTQLTLLEPTEGDVTITAGQSVTIKVNVGGKVPSPSNPDRVRVLLRHNQATTEYEEIALEKGEISREWQVRVPDYLVRNGFWYKVAAGDFETPEYRVTVRSLPLFTDFEVTYDYPAYTRLKPDTAKDGHLHAIRGTKVTITGKTNRTVKDGKLTFDPPTRDALPGKLIADKPDSIQFSFTLLATGKYRVTFASSEGERSPEPPPFNIVVDEDLPPVITIVAPKEDEITLPANSQLAVDAAITDDIGIEKLTLKMRLVEPMKRDLADKPYQEGKSFRRTEKDGTFSWPTNLEFKDSVDFTKLTDTAGLPVVLKEGMRIEYWLEATDNRTKAGSNGPEPDPNLGKSASKFVRVAPPVVAMEEKKNLDEKKDQRKNEEKAHNQTQQQRLNNEPRQPNQPNATPPKDPENKTPPEGDPKPPMMPDPMMPMPKGMDMMPPPMMPPEPKKNPDGTPMPKGMENTPPMMPPEMNPMNMGTPNMAPMPSTPEENKAKEDAQRVQEKLDQQKGGGMGKGGPSKEEDRANPAEPKPMGMMGDTPPPDSDPKEPPKPNDPSNPMMGSNAAEPKPMGAPQKPEDPATTKPEPKNDPSSPMNPKGDTPPSDTKAPPKDPMKGAGGMDKPTPMPMSPPMPMPMDPSQPSKTEDKSGGGAGKPSTEKKPEPGMMMDPMPMPGMNQDPAPGSAQPKPMPSTDPGAEKPESKPMSGASPQDPKNKKPDNEGGAAKPQGGPPPSDTKPNPKDMNPMPGGGDGASEPKPMPGDPMMNKPGAGEAKPAGSPPPMGDGDKPSPDQKPMPGSGGNSDKKPTPEQIKEFKDAVKDLNSKDDKTRKDAQDKLDKQVGEQNRKDIEKGMKDFEKNVKDLNSKDDKTRKDAQDKLDKQVGEQNRKDIEDIQKGMNSNDPMERAKAEEKLKDLQAKAGADGKEPKEPKGGNGPDPKQKIDPKEVEKAMKDLQSPDKATRDAAKDALDKSFGKGAGDKAEQLQNDLKSEDKDKRAAAQKEIEDMKKKADEFAKNNPPKKENGAGGGKKVDPKEVEKAFDDLNSDDPKKREEAKKNLDDMLGKGAGDKADEANKKSKSDDLGEQADGRKDLGDLRKKAEEMAKKGEPQPKGKELSKEEIEQLANKMKDLANPDEAKRKAAEQDLDKQIGEQARKKIQEAMKDPKKAEELKKELEELAKKGGGEVDNDGKITPKGGDPTVPLREAMKEDARNRAKSAQLQLENFEKNKDNQKLLEDTGMTPEQYEKFLENYRKEVAKLKKEADELEKADPTKVAPTVNVSGATKIDSKGGASVGNAGGPTVPAPGYAEAIKRFNQEAQKATQPKK